VNWAPLLTLLILTASASGMQSVRAANNIQPVSSFTIGPGTIVSVRVLDLPFGKARLIVSYKTDTGDTLEVSQPTDEILLLTGMHGFLTYTTHPERVINFRITEPQTSLASFP